MLPPPTLTFTIPSVQDDLVLQCRVYHPTCLAPSALSQISEWRKRAAIVAHPYAPLGGCYDDPVVDIVASTILKQGFVVGTFNFRGAGSSKGRTSWQSKPEQNDYISFIGFMIYYIHHLSPPTLPVGRARLSHSNPELYDLSPVPSQALPPPHISEPQHISSTSRSASSNLPGIAVQKEQACPQTRLLLAGYSYGALVTTCLPPIISSIIAPFQTPLPGSAHAEIRRRAECLATQQNESIIIQVNWLLEHSHTHKRGRGRGLQIDDRVASPKIRKSSGSVRVGGEEDLRRASYDSYRSRHSFSIETPERVRKSIDRVRSIARSQHRYPPQRQNSHDSISSYKSAKQSSESSIEQNTPDEESVKVEAESSMKEVPEIVHGLQTAYLLVSPLQGWINGLATMWSSKSLKWKDSENDMKLTIDPTLALFGDDDIFVSVKRLRTWAEKLEGAGNAGQFRYREVSGAGHFWHDSTAVKVLRDEIKEFVGEL